MQNYHDPPSEKSTESRYYLGEPSSLKVEIKPINWCNQRLEASSVHQPEKNLRHNLNEEIIHTCITLV